METLRWLLFEEASIRYVARLHEGRVETASRPERSGASSAESDKYEELIVNPTLMTLLRQRGEIDCGGLDFVVIRYGSFFQLVMPTESGHVSVAVESDGDPLTIAELVRTAIGRSRSRRP